MPGIECSPLLGDINFLVSTSQTHDARVLEIGNNEVSIAKAKLDAKDI
jgi:hypothetical protein